MSFITISIWFKRQWKGLTGRYSAECSRTALKLSSRNTWLCLLVVELQIDFFKRLKSVKLNGRPPLHLMTSLWRGMRSLCVSADGTLGWRARGTPPGVSTVDSDRRSSGEERAPPAGHPHLALSMRICCFLTAFEETRWAFVVCRLCNNSRRMPLAELNLAWRHHRSGQEKKTRWRNLNKTEKKPKTPNVSSQINCLCAKIGSQ